MDTVFNALCTAWGNYRFAALFVVCLIMELFFLKSKRKLLLFPCFIMVVVVLNPLFYYFWDKINEAKVYWRTLWLIPVIIVCAVLPAMTVDALARRNAIERMPGKRVILKDDTEKRIMTARGQIIILLVLVGMAAAVALCGNWVYSLPSTAFTQTDNAEKLPSDVVSIAEELLELDNNPAVVCDSAVSVYIRQYDGRIRTPYARSAVYGTPGKLGKTMYNALNNGYYSELALSMVNYDYDYLVTDNQDQFKRDSLELAGFELLRQISEYGIYRAHAVRTEKREYNDLQQVISVTTVDENGNAENGNGGYATIHYQYDSYGRICYEFHRDRDGNGVADSSGKAGYRREYNYLGQLVKETNLGPDENPIIANFATRRCKYNGRRLLISESYYDESDNPMIRTDEQYFCREITYDNAKQVSAEHYYGLSGDSVLNSKGFAAIEYVRDEKGNAIEERVFDEMNQPTLREEGYSIVRREFEEKNLISEKYYDTRDERINIDPGYSELRNEYREDGKLSLTWFYDSEGNRFSCGSSLFHEYLQSLMGRDLCILFSVKDEGTRALTQTIMDDLNALGIKTYLLDKYRYSYYAIITPKETQEAISDRETLREVYDYNGTTLEVSSGGCLVGNISSIRIDGVEYSKNVRGMNIVVYDPASGEVIDSVTFDTCADNMCVTR